MASPATPIFDLSVRVDQPITRGSYGNWQNTAEDVADHQNSHVYIKVKASQQGASEDALAARNIQTLGTYLFTSVGSLTQSVPPSTGDRCGSGHVRGSGNTSGRARVACTNCRKVGKRCSNFRPCERCVSNGQEHSCVNDEPRRKRVAIHQHLEGHTLTDYLPPTSNMGYPSNAVEAYGMAGPLLPPYTGAASFMPTANLAAQDMRSQTPYDIVPNMAQAYFAGYNHQGGSAMGQGTWIPDSNIAQLPNRSIEGYGATMYPNA